MAYYYSSILCIILIVLPYSALAQGNGTISVGSFLTAADEATSWYSHSGDFAFGFKKLQNQFLLSIWYNKIPDKTIVWFANDGKTVSVGSKVQLTADRGLVLSDSRGKELWRSEMSGTASNGVFNDTGNFIIFGRSSTNLWDSFSNPTDTLLPTQTLRINGMLNSRLSETNFTKGRFQLRLLDNGNLVLNSRDILTDNAYIPYYGDNIPDRNASRVEFSTKGYMYIVERNGAADNLTANGAIPAGYYHRAILHFDGILVQYYHPKVFTGSPNWTAVWQIPENICLSILGTGSSGACGFNSVCTLDSDRRVDCECPESYSLVDPNDKYGSCKTNGTQNCDDDAYNKDLYDFVEITDTDWPLSDYAQLKPISEFDCRRNCLNDCFCAVAIYREDSCWKKKLPLSYGKKDPSVNSKAFLKYRKANDPPEDARTISVGSSLTAVDKATSWYSLSGDFACGFKKVQDQFLLSIWYDKIPDKTIVWFVNNGTTVPAGSKVQLTADHGLVLSDSQGREFWRSAMSGTASIGVLDDTGNFIISDSSSAKLWDSFSNPTDTLLPAQTLGINGRLYSRLSETNFTKGRFQLRLLDNGNLVLNSRDILTDYVYDAYYRSQTNDTNAGNEGFKVELSTTGYISILRRNGTIVNLTNRAIPFPSTAYYHRATLNFDGVLVQYYHPKAPTETSEWTAVWHIPENICLDIIGDTGSGACGFNSVCGLNDSKRVECECPKSYSLLDPNDTHGSCKPNFTQNCGDNGSSEELYDLVEITNTIWPESNYERMQPISEVECRRHCLNDCFCAVAIYQGDSCLKKKLPLSNGRKDRAFDGKAFLKFSKGDNPIYQKKRSTLILVFSVLLGSSIFVNFVLIVVACFSFFYIYHKKRINSQHADNSVETNVRRFTNKELVEATNGFKEELGRGSFGIVYKGVIQMSSSIIVAVKKIDRLVQDGAREFKTEVNVIAQTQHKNLVRLVGFCEEEEHLLLVYEYMVNGTLASFLFSSVKPSWGLRKHIALGIARGLAYLHEECSTQIIHCDIKPQNILLDEHCNARISDFGLAKLLMLNQSRTNTGIRGTKGYVAPEWFRNTSVTVKVDVYSYGVLVLEIICCRKSVEDQEFGEKAILTDWVWDCFRDGRMVDLVENVEEDVLSDWERVERFVMVGIWCVQEDPSLRPTMRKVIQMLEGVVDVPDPPCPSPFS